MSHYFTDNSDLTSNRREFNYYLDDEIFCFTTDNGVFSKSNVDYGSHVLIRNIYRKALGNRVLDLGSGYGPIGIVVKRFNPNVEVEMVDVNPRANELAALNCQKNNVDIKVHLCEDILTLENTFDTVIFNPPIRAGKKIIYELYEKAYEKLNDRGSLVIVIQRKQGAESSIGKLETLFDDVQVLDRDKGYWIIQATKHQH